MFQYLSLTLYNLSLRCYWLGIYFASFFNEKARLWLNGRKDWKQRLRATELKQGTRIWFHCASLGEFEQARPVIEKIRIEKPDAFIIVTFFSPSGYEVRKNYEQANLVTYLPLDTPSNATAFIELLKPDLAFFVKYEFWFHYLNQLHQSNIPVILFSSVFRKEQVFFQWYGGLFRSMLKMFRKIFVQNRSSVDLLKTIPVDSEIAFDTRFDRVYQIAESRKSFPAIEKFKTGSKILIAGSTWQKDEELIIQCINEGVLQEYKYIIAPHNIDQNRINEIISTIKAKTRRFSELSDANTAETDVVIVDNVGNLSSLYGYGDIAYVGGGFNASVHNVLEAVVYEIPVLFGPNFQKSEEAKDLVDLKLGFTINSYEDLKQKVAYLANDFVSDKGNIQKLKNYIQSHLGGAEKVVEAIHNYLK